MYQPSQELLKEYYGYCPETGIFTRVKSSGNNAKVGEIAGYYDNGYLKISLLGKQFKGHRLAFLYMTGTMPLVVDHIDGNPSNNRWANLRAVSAVENQYNSKIRKDNITGIKGVSLKKGNYYAQIWVLGSRKTKLFTIHKYSSPEEALKAAENWLISMREEHHKEFARHG